MNIELWLLLLTRVASGVLVSQGRPELGGLLNDLTTAYRQGKDVDDIMAAIAAKWDSEGPPSFDDIATTRQDIQSRMD